MDLGKECRLPTDDVLLQAAGQKAVENLLSQTKNVINLNWQALLPVDLVNERLC